MASSSFVDLAGGISITRQEWQELRAEMQELKQQQRLQASLLQQISEKCFTAIATLQVRHSRVCCLLHPSFSFTADFSRGIDSWPLNPSFS
jgi:hypothetical protein